MAEKAAKASASTLFDDMFQNIRKGAEATLSMQQEMLSQWSTLLPGMPAPQTAWMKQMQQIRSKWVETVSELARKRRKAMDRQYNAAMESLDAALYVVDSNTPEEFRRRSEQFCRKSLDGVREIAETQAEEFQEAATKWTDLLAKSTP